MPPLTPPPSAPTTTQSYEWEQRTIQVPGNTKGSVTVEGAYCYGPLAVHPIIGDDDRIDNVPNANKYAITSLSANGRLVCATIEVDCAIKIVETMVHDAKVCACLRKKDRETIVKYMEQDVPWIFSWLIDCRQQGKWLPTKSYKQQMKEKQS